MLFRVLWRWRHVPPPLPRGVSRVEAVLAHFTHFVLYGILIVMPLAGYLNAAAAGHSVSLFGMVSIPPLLPEDGRLSQVAIAIHLTGQYVLYCFVALHVTGALYHGMIRRDGVLEQNAAAAPAAAIIAIPVSPVRRRRR